MRTTRLSLTSAVVAAVSACSGDPVSSASRSTGAIDVRQSQVAAACTRRWTNAVNGNWQDAVKWSPVGVPQPTDVVCINARGRYTVTLDAVVSVNEVQVGDGVSKAELLILPIGQLDHGAKLQINPLAVVEAQGCPLPFGLGSGALVVDGTLRTAGPCSLVLVTGTSLENNGLISAPIETQFVILAATNVLNTGTLDAGAPVLFDMTRGGNFLMNGGAVTGTSPVTIIGNGFAPNRSTLVWTDGTLGEQTPGGAPVVQLDGPNLTLTSTTLVGSVGMTQGLVGTQLTGNIGAGARVVATIDDPHPIALSSGGSGPFTVDGTLELTNGLAIGPVGFIAPTGIVNNNTIRTVGGPAALVLDSLVNNAAIVLADSLSVGGTGTLLRNRGTVTVNGGALKLPGGTLASEGTIVGSAVYANAAINGWGDAGNATLTASTISPGDPATNAYKTLAFSGLALDGLSVVTLDVGGTLAGTYDQLQLNGATTLAGTLTLRTNTPFVGGVCGQTVPVIPWGAGATVAGQFGKTLGRNPSPGHAWRVSRGTTAYYAVGYDPTLQISQSTSTISVTEGLGAVPYSLCLKNAPGTNVGIIVSSLLQQVSPVPVLLTATPTNWEFPLPATVTAINDVTVEPPMTDSVKFVVSSGDPAYNGFPLAAIGAAVSDNDGNADLALTIPVPPPPLTLGQVFNVTFRSTNNGPTLSTGASLFIPVPTGFKYLSATGGTCSANASGLTCQVPGAASGAFVDVVITAQAKAVGTFVVTMTLTGQQPDANSANNTLVRNIVVQ